MWYTQQKVVNQGSLMDDQPETCSECMTFEFRPENVAPLHHDSNALVRSQWHIQPIHFVVYRIAAAILLIVWMLVDATTEARRFYSDHPYVWFLYATNWGFILLCFNGVLLAVVTAAYFIKNKRVPASSRTPDTESGGESQESLPVGLMFTWILYNIAANSALVVTISYWSFMLAYDTADFLITPMSRIKHTLNSIYIVSDLMISAVPVRIFHIVYPLFTGAVYTLFNAMYFTNDGVGPDGKPYAYPIMDWRNPIESAISSAMGFIISTLVQILLYGLYRLRLWMYFKVTGIRVSTHPPLQPSTPETESILGVAENRDRINTYSSTEHIEMETAK